MHKIPQENINIFYGYKCNYACDQCTSGSNHIHDTSYDPDLDEILDSIPTLAKIFNVNSMLTLLGGEPFLYWDERIVPISKELDKYFPGSRINIFTNGQLIGKNIERVFDLANQIKNFSLTITNHLEGLDMCQPKKIYDSGIDKFLADSRIVKIHNTHYHIKGSIYKNIYFFNSNDSPTWKKHYKTTIDGKIKPYATNDPRGSMANGCIGNLCSCLLGKKFYKCSLLATIKDQLHKVNQLNDPDWRKYLSYPFIDISDIDQQLLQDFIDSYGHPTTWCDMCANSNDYNIHWRERTYQMIFSKPVIKNIP